MIIRKLDPVQHLYSSPHVNIPPYRLSRSFPFTCIEHHRLNLPCKTWSKLDYIVLDRSEVFVTLLELFRRYLKLSPIPQVELKKEIERNFVDQLFTELNEKAKSHFNHLVASGDQSFNRAQLDAAENYYAEALKSISGKEPIKEAICSRELAAVYLERSKQDGSLEDRKEECIKASGLLNYGLLLATKQNNYELQKELNAQLNDVEEVLCLLCGTSKISNRGSVWDTENKQRLRNIRKEIQNELAGSFDDPEEVKRLFQEITSKMKAFTTGLIKQSIEVLGRPPLNCEYTIIGLGSMARGEMTPFSDLEFAVLLEEGKDTDEVKQYFRDLTHLIHLRVLNLGETIVPALGIKALDGFYDGVTLRGFAFDGKGCLEKGHKTPLGKKGVFELIQTPKKMAEFQGENGGQYWYEQEAFLPAELHDVTHIYGKKRLIDSYRNHINIALNKEARDGSSLKEYYAKKHLFDEDMIAFMAGFSREEEEMLFELKKDLYRMSHLFVERLFLNECGNYPENDSFEGTFSKIDWLLSQNRLSEKGARNLKWMFGRVLLARLKNCYKTDSLKSIDDPTCNSPGEIGEKICIVNHLFCRAATENLQDKRPLYNKIFYSEAPYLIALMRLRFGKALEAKESILKHLESNPLDIDGLILSVRVFNKSGDKDASLKNLSKVDKLVNALGADLIQMKVKCFSRIGVLYGEISEHVKETEFFEKAWHLVMENPQLQNHYCLVANNLGISYLSRGRTNDAQKILEQALQAFKDKSIPFIPRVRQAAQAYCLYNLSHVYNELNDVGKVIECLEQSLAIMNVTYGRHHHLITSAIAYLGRFYFRGGSVTKGIEYLQKALDITVEKFGMFHKDSVEIFLDLSLILNGVDSRKGIVSSEYLEIVEKIESSRCHFFYSIAQAWQRINRPENAEKLLLKTIKMAKAQKSPTALATSYHLLAGFYMEYGRNSEMLTYTKLALEESRKNSEGRPSSSIILNLVLLVKCKISQFFQSPLVDVCVQKESIHALLKEAEEMSIEISKTTDSSDLLCIVYSILGQFEFRINGDLPKAVHYFLKSVNEVEKLYGPQSVNLIENFFNLCTVYLSLQDKSKESLAYFERLLYLSKRHFGTSSDKYAKAYRCYKEYSNFLVGGLSVDLKIG